MSQAWYNSNYILRRGVQITSPDGAPAGHPVNFTLKDPAKSLQSHNADVLVIYSSPTEATPNYQVLPVKRSTNADGSILVQWALVNALLPNQTDSGSYYVYEANANIASIIIPPVYSPPAWPIQDTTASPSISYLRPGVYWNDGISSTFGATATIGFYGTAIQIFSNLGPNQGIAQLVLDNGTPQNIDLYSANQINEVVYENDNLNSNFHKIVLTVTSKANAASEGTSINITNFNIVKYLDVVDLGEEIFPIIWSSIAFGGT